MEMVPHIVAAMPEPPFQPFHEILPSDARQDLYTLLRTSTTFFHAATKALWRSLPSLEILLRVLYYDLIRSNAASQPIQPCEMETYVYENIGRLPNASNGGWHSTIQRFLFYAQSIVRLRANSQDTPGAFYRYLTDRLPAGVVTFPRLEEVSWSEHQPCLVTGGIVHLLCSAQVLILTLKFLEQPSITRRTTGRDFYTLSVIDTLLMISDVVPGLRELNVPAPMTIPIPISAILRYEHLHRANLHITLAGPNSVFVPEFASIEVGALRAIELHWNPITDPHVVYLILCAGELCELTVMVYGSLGSSFVDNFLYLAASTPPQLTRFEIYTLGNTAPTLCARRFVDKIKPLLSRRALQHVALMLTGHSLRIDSQDMDYMAHAWPDLRTLNLSFPLVEGCVYPNICHVLVAMCLCCPQLRLLHVPALSTSGNTCLALPTFPGSLLGLISSDSARFDHPLLDVAFSLYRTFPHLEQTGQRDENLGWGEVNTLLEALKQGDHPTILEHVAHSMRAGVYANFPYVSCSSLANNPLNCESLSRSFFVIVLDALQGMLNQMKHGIPSL